MSWPLVKLGDICDLFNGYAFKSTDYVDESNTLSCRMSNIRPGGKFDIEYNARYLPDSFVEKYKQFLLKDGDVVIAMTDLADSPKILGVPTIIKTDGRDILLNQRVGKLIIKEQNKVYFPYLQIALNSLKVRSVYKRFAGGGLQINLGKEDLLSVEIPLPSLPEQQKIASILDAADNLRQKDQQLIEKYTALSQSLFLVMFGDPESNPMGFERSTVGEQCIVKGGKRVPKGDSLVKENTGYPYIKAGNIKNGKVTIRNLEYLTSETREIIKNYIVNEGDVCITVVGANIGDIGIVPKDLHLANLTENANKLLIKNHMALNNFYLCFSLQMEFIQQQIKKKTMAVGVPKLALFRIQELELLVPPITLQNKFTESIQSIEAQKQLALASLEKSEALFNSLLQRAFKGELTT